MEIVYRPIRSTLEESLKELKSFKTLADLFIYFITNKNLKKGELSIIPYDLDIDSRIFWNETCYLCYKGCVIGFVGTR